MLLGAIQFYLVSNTYHLTRENYFKEVASKIDTFQKDPAIKKVHEKALSGVLTLSANYAAGQIDQAIFLKKFKQIIGKEKLSADSAWTHFAIRNPQLSDILYLETYDRVVIGKSGQLDSLLYSKSAPLALLGSLSKTGTETWQDFDDPKEAIISQDSSESGAAGNYKVNFMTSRHIGYRSDQAVFMRMLLVFLLSLTLFVAMIVTLFLNFKAIYQQKKIADIRSDFANNITHELQTPISTIALIVKTLKTGTVRSDERLLDETIAALGRQQQRLHSSVASVLESAMLEKNDIPFEPIIMPDFLQSYLDDYQKTGRAFEIGLLGTPVTIQTGKQALERILRNILENAIKYSPDGTTIRVTTGLTAKHYTIAIQNEGPGIAKAYHRHIFEKFYRVPQQNLHTVKGLGLGLFLCTELIARLNGSISVESAEGKGATFTIHLPVT
ncbi:sensor histidine kinase [Mucilaginibacter jinjuensis]|uniref:histidine kinase n=1 Tax=Mucilaginibacter jinjuensis TaxID=1176721 RepID=A0ABY7TBD8_9SPHI|nr:HAMP domain-containing sensor histidine kinase [Mucilaginibacter jinjuensis]WCT13390.1 HAMP domain-containing sensor histidine kinase [Mucilaginibacter jinjuensis]